MDIKPELLRVLDALPPSRQTEVLDFARFLHQQVVVGELGRGSQPSGIAVRTAPATTLIGLTGLVTLGGDAVADTEALYDPDGCH
jgi:hypothetical protein